MVQDENGIEISFNKIKITLFLLIFMALLAYLYFSFFGKQIIFQSYQHMVFIYVFIACLGYFCIVNFIKYLFLLFDPGPALIINSFGIFYRPNTFMSFEIPWNYIYAIKIHRVKSGKYPKLMIEYDPELFSQISFTNKLLFFPKLLFKPKSISINTSLLMTSYKKLFDMLTEELDNQLRIKN